MTQDEKYMSMAMSLAVKGLGHVAPNPMVGAVIVANGRVIGSGYHMKYGSWHAEVNAVNSVLPEDEHLLPQSTMYVTLEPCSHYGKTPPCAKLLIDKKIKKVVIANNDPFPQVAGRGIRMLTDAGIEVATGVLEREGRELNKRFFTLHEKHRPYIFLKWAQTADGFIGKRGSMEIISNEETRRLAHSLRATEMAILVGWGTVINDNPQLSTRYAEGGNPLRLSLFRGDVDELQRLSQSLKIVDKSALTIIFAEREIKLNNFARTIRIDFGQDVLPQMMQELWRMNVSSLIVEGGACMLQSFIDAGLWDEARVETAAGLTFGDGVSAPVLSGARLDATEEFGANKVDFYKRGC